jgi:Putative outer membrane beta-barrel porin, MtrB/PioB
MHGSRASKTLKTWKQPAGLATAAHPRIGQSDARTISNLRVHRYYDEADRNRNRGSVTLTLTPIDTVGVNFIYSGGKDDFDLEDEACASLLTCERFGLLSAETQAFTVGLDVNPRETIGVGAYYGYENTAPSSSRVTPILRPTRPGSTRRATGMWTMARESTPSPSTSTFCARCRGQNFVSA